MYHFLTWLTNAALIVVRARLVSGDIDDRVESLVQTNTVLQHIGYPGRHRHCCSRSQGRRARSKSECGGQESKSEKCRDFKRLVLHNCGGPD